MYTEVLEQDADIASGFFVTFPNRGEKDGRSGANLLPQLRSQKGGTRLDVGAQIFSDHRKPLADIFATAAKMARLFNSLNRCINNSVESSDDRRIVTHPTTQNTRGGDPGFGDATR